MRLAVVGAGNAGCISALHFNQYAPDLEIEIYHDSKNTPIERVGQGTVLNVTKLLFSSLNFDWSVNQIGACLLYTSPSPRDLSTSRMPSSA